MKDWERPPMGDAESYGRAPQTFSRTSGSGLAYALSSSLGPKEYRCMLDRHELNGLPS